MPRISQSQIRDEQATDLHWLGWAASLAAVLLPQIPAQLDAGLWAVLGVVALTGVAMAAVGFGASRRTWRAVVGLVVMVAVPFVSVALVDTPLFGRVVTGTADTAPHHRWASAYRLTGAAVRPDLAGVATTVSDTGRGRSVVSRTVTPVVATGWATDLPVRIWLVDDNGRPSPAYPRGAELPVARLVGWADTDRRRAVQTVARREGLTVPADVLLVRPVDDPAAVWWSGWLKLSAVAAAAGGTWTLLRRLG